MDEQNLTDIGVRTLESDTNSIAEEGGGAPKPYIPSPETSEETPPLGADYIPSSMPVASAADSEGTPPRPDEGGFAPAAPGGTPKPPAPPADMELGERRNPLPLLIGLVAVLVIGAVVYFFVVPALSGNKSEQQTETVPETEAAATATEPVVSQDTLVPPAEVATSTDGGRATSTEVAATSTSPAIPSHISLFGTPPDSTEHIVITDIQTSGELLAKFALSGTQVPLFREVVLTGDDGGFAPFADVIALFAPDVFTQEVSAYFQPDATYYTYTDGNGTWFGLVARLASGADMQAAKTAVAAFESQQSNVTRFFSGSVTNPAAWKDGSAGSVTGRYLTFGEQNAAFNYGWSGRTLLIGASYNAYKAAANKL